MVVVLVVVVVADGLPQQVGDSLARGSLVPVPQASIMDFCPFLSIVSRKSDTTVS